MHIVGVGRGGNGLEELRFGEQVLRSGQNGWALEPILNAVLLSDIEQ